MKTILRYFVPMMILFGWYACDGDDEQVDYRELPSKIHRFVDTYFADVQVTKAEKSDEGRYRVWLNNDFELTFYQEGDWQKIDGKLQTLPYSMQMDILPGGLLTYVSTHYPNADIIEAERDGANYEVELNTVPILELKFDSNGTIINAGR